MAHCICVKILKHFIFDKLIIVWKNKFLFWTVYFSPLLLWTRHFQSFNGRNVCITLQQTRNRRYLFVIPWSKPTHFLNPSVCSLNVTNMHFCVILKHNLNVLNCHFFEWSMDYRTAWNEWKVVLDAKILCFRMILWCFSPVDTTHLFQWETIAPFGCGVMTRLWVQTTGFGVCLWQSLYNSSGHLSNTQRLRMPIKNLILDAEVHTLFSENKPMSTLYCQRWKCLLSSMMEMFEEIFCM